jgi:hypothetical protein
MEAIMAKHTGTEQNEITETLTAKPTSAARSNAPQPVSRKTWIIVSSVVGGLVLLIVVSMALAMFGLRAMHYDNDRFIGGERPAAINEQFGQMRGDRMGAMGYATVQSNTSRINGVVTKIDGSMLTVAGYGTTSTVKTTDTTTFYGSATNVGVNDTVTVLATKASDGSLTATSVGISRQ